MFSRLFSSSRRLLAALALGLAVGNGILAAALAWVALRPHPVVMVPMVRRESVALPEEIPPEAVQRFALHYLSYFDDYTAHTCKDRSNYVLGFVSYEFSETVAKKLTERLRYVEKAREAVQLLLPPPEAVEIAPGPGRRRRAAVTAIRRVYLSDRLAEESDVRYVVEVQAALPRQGNPFGLVVTGQQVSLVPREKPAPVPQQASTERKER
jgi:hypothetical protein